MIRLFPNSGGWLEVVCGPMFSGKSEELIRRLRRAELAGQRALIVKPRLDDRYDISHVVSHAGARMRAVAVDDPADIPGLVDGAPAPADGATIVVGALEQYEARCRSCHQLAAPALAAG